MFTPRQNKIPPQPYLNSSFCRELHICGGVTSGRDADEITSDVTAAAAEMEKKMDAVRDLGCDNQEIKNR